MQGTPTLVVIDRSGIRRFQRLGHVDDLSLGSIIGTLLAESPVAGELSRRSDMTETNLSGWLYVWRSGIEALQELAPRIGCKSGWCSDDNSASGTHPDKLSSFIYLI